MKVKNDAHNDYFSLVNLLDCNNKDKLIIPLSDYNLDAVNRFRTYCRHLGYMSEEVGSWEYLLVYRK